MDYHMFTCTPYIIAEYLLVRGTISPVRLPLAGGVTVI